MSSKVSKDLDFSLVSTKNFSEILPSNGLGLGPGEVGQGCPKVFHLWRHSEKIRNSNQNNFFFIANYKPCRVMWAFKQFSTAFSARVELHSHKATCDPAGLAWTAWFRLDTKLLSNKLIAV